jgi:DNA-binding transcriptional MerR regulator
MNDQPAHSHRHPPKRYYRVREASAIVGVPAYVLRFWETQFPSLRPKRTASGHRLYQPGDLTLLLEIKRLLHEQHYTIAGARQHLAAAAGSSTPEPEAQAEILAQIYRELEHLRRLLDDPA